MVRSSSAAILFLSALAGHSSAQAVHTVDDDGPADFSDLQSAVDAASSGDVVLIEPGTYPGVPDPVNPGAFLPVVVDGKSLVVIAEQPGSVVIEDGIEFENLVPGDYGALRGVGFGTKWQSGIHAIEYLSLRTLWIEDCTLPPPATTQPLGYPPGRVSVAGGGVHVTRSEVHGAPAGQFGNTTAVENGSRVWIYGSVLAGGTYENGSQGAALGGSLYKAFCSGSSLNTVWLGFLSKAWFLDSLIGIVSGLDESTHQVVPGEARSFFVTSPVREGQTATLDFRGVPGDVPLLFLSTGPDPGLWNLFDPFLNGVFLLEEAATSLHVLPPLGATGQLQVTHAITPMPSGMEAAVGWLQAVHLTPAGELFTSGGSLLVILDEAIP